MAWKHFLKQINKSFMFYISTQFWWIFESYGIFKLYGRKKRDVRAAALAALG
jgi:hypothetical protein